MNSKILQALRKNNNYLSGEDISEKLNISRAAVWKHIQELRKDGYDIEAVPHLGYKLISSPDKLTSEEIKENLHTKIFGRKIYYFDSVGSTMDEAFRLGMQNEPEGTIVCAESQLKGRGRLGRSWVSSHGKGIYFSIILRPEILPNEASKLTLLSAVGVCEAIREFTGLDCQIKWPNDLLINEKKVAGILTELSAEMDMVRFVIVGIGININNNKNLLPVKSTSLKEELGSEVLRVEILRFILKTLEEKYLLFGKNGFEEIAGAWRAMSATLGRRVKVFHHKEHTEGQAVDIDSDGGLIIRKDSGLSEKVLTGDVVFCR